MYKSFKSDGKESLFPMHLCAVLLAGKESKVLPFQEHKETEEYDLSII